MGLYSIPELKAQLQDIEAKLRAPNMDEQTKKRLNQHKEQLTRELGFLLSGKNKDNKFSYNDNDTQINLHNDKSMAEILGLDIKDKNSQAEINSFRQTFLEGTKDKQSQITSTSKMPEKGSVEVVKIKPWPDPAEEAKSKNEDDIDTNPPLPRRVFLDPALISDETETVTDDEPPPMPTVVDVSGSKNTAPQQDAERLNKQAEFLREIINNPGDKDKIKADYAQKNGTDLFNLPDGLLNNSNPEVKGLAEQIKGLIKQIKDKDEKE